MINPNNTPMKEAGTLRLQAASLGMTWDHCGGPVGKILEELDEVEDAIQRGDRLQIASEFGDLIFTVAAYAAYNNIDLNIDFIERYVMDGITRVRPGGYVDEILKELGEIEDAIERGDCNRIERELGNLILTVTWFAYCNNINAGYALQEATVKFDRRFSTVKRYIKERYGELKRIPEAEIMSLWRCAKTERWLRHISKGGEI